MNIFDIINSVDTDKINLEERVATGRRELFRQFGDWGKKMALAAVPFGAATLSSNKAMAQGGGTGILDVLNFALLLEYLENEFYMMGLDSVVKGKKEEQVFMQIGKHERQHVEFLKTAISGSGGTPIDKPKFDFTVGGAFTPFTDYTQFLVLAQAFEDTGVRAYKGQAANLISSDAVLTAALQIHSVEARHAAKVRMIRGDYGWVTFSNRGDGMPEATQAVYRGEDNRMQAGIDLKTVTTVGDMGITAAFDEPLSREEITAIATLFLAKS